MSEKNNIHLCCGTLFALITEAKKGRNSIRDSFGKNADKLSDVEIYEGFCKIITGEKITDVSGDSINKIVSQFKACNNDNSIYIPFTHKSIQSSFLLKIKDKKEEIVERAHDFRVEYLNSDRCIWLIAAIVETLTNDDLAVKDYPIEIKSGEYITIGELENIEEIDFDVFITSILGYLIKNFPDSSSGRDTFLSWFEQASPRAKWKFKANIGNNISAINVNFLEKGAGLPDSVGLVASEKMINAKEKAIDKPLEVEKTKEIVDEKTVLEARRFCLRHEKEMSLLPLCQIAYNVDKIHNFNREIYNDYSMCESKVKKEILKLANLPEISFTEEWRYEIVRKFDKNTMERGLASQSYLYDNAKYFHRAYDRYAEVEIAEYNPHCFVNLNRNYTMGLFSNMDTDSFVGYVGNYIWYKENREDVVNHEVPMDYLWRDRQMASCPEPEVTYWMCMFVIACGLHMRPNLVFEDEKFDNINVDEELIKTQEDIYFYALLHLYLLYEVDYGNEKLW